MVACPVAMYMTISAVSDPESVRKLRRRKGSAEMGFDLQVHNVAAWRTIPTSRGGGRGPVKSRPFPYEGYICICISSRSDVYGGQPSSCVYMYRERNVQTNGVRHIITSLR